MTGAFDELVWTAPVAALARADEVSSAPTADAADMEVVEAPAAAVSRPQPVAAGEPLAFQPPLPDDPGADGSAEDVHEGERKW